MARGAQKIQAQEKNALKKQKEKKAGAGPVKKGFAFIFLLKKEFIKHILDTKVKPQDRLKSARSAWLLFPPSVGCVE